MSDESTAAPDDVRERVENYFRLGIPLLARVFLIIFLTHTLTYVIRTIFNVIYYMIQPIVTISVLWILYTNGGLSSTEGFSRAMDDLFMATQDAFNATVNIIKGVTEAVNP